MNMKNNNNNMTNSNNKYYDYKTISSLIRLKTGKNSIKESTPGVRSCRHSCPKCKEKLIHYNFYFIESGDKVRAKAKCPKCGYIDEKEHKIFSDISSW